MAQDADAAAQIAALQAQLAALSAASGISIPAAPPVAPNETTSAPADADADAATERAVAAIAPAALVAAFVAELEAAKASGAFPAMAAVDVRALTGAITVDAKAVSWRKPSGSTDRGGEPPGLEISYRCISISWYRVININFWFGP